MRRVGRGLFLVVAAVFVLAAEGPVSSALAEPPNVTINFIPSPTSTTSPTFEGMAGTAVGDEPTVSVTLLREGSIVASGNPSVSLNGEWEFPVHGHLADGSYSLQVFQRNEVGEPGSAERSFRVDSTAPEVTINAVAPITKVVPLALSGAAGTQEGDRHEVLVAVYQGSSVGGTVVASGSVGSGATWSYTGPHLINGTYTAQATQGDSAGNARSVATTFKVEVEAPKVTITPVPSPTVEARPIIKGTAGIAEGDIRTVSVTIKGTLKGEKCVFKETSASAPVNASGEWEYHAGPLCDGTYSVSATQKNEAEVTGKSEPASFEVNTLAPLVSLSTATFGLRGATELVTGPTPSFAGEAAAGPEDAKAVTVNVYKGTTPTGTPVSVPGAVTVSKWTAGPAPKLAGGTYTAQATQLDEAGNVGKSAPITFAVDATPPVVTVTEPVNKHEFHVSRPVFSGSAGTASGDLTPVTLKIYEVVSGKETLAQTLTIPSAGGKWAESGGPRLANGTYTAQAEQSDDVGNVGKSAPVTFTIATNAPSVTLNPVGLVPRGAGLISGPNPSFNGTAGSAPEDSASVVVNLYSGTSTSERNLVRRAEGARSGTSWTVGPVAGLPEGTYTAQAEQADSNSPEPGFSKVATFVVDATPPNVTLTSPPNGSSTASGSQVVTGTAGAAPGDVPEVTVQLFAGAGTAGALVQSVNVPAVGGVWSATVAGLGPGTYTVRAEQSDDVGNVGLSAPATFTVNGGAASSIAHPLLASFSWVPSAPHTGERVSLLSGSTDTASPITSFAWDLAGTGAFTAGTPVMGTSFSTPGKHLVQLRVTDAIGLSAVAAELIPVTGPVLPLMRPFPIVRIVASYSASAVRLKVLSVQASGGARISIACRGHGCPVKAQTRVAAAGKRGKAPVVFRRFERSLHAGVTLEVRVSKPGQIGKYTSFTIRHGRLPLRSDSCLGPAASKPIACPSS